MISLCPNEVHDVFNSVDDTGELGADSGTLLW